MSLDSLCRWQVQVSVYCAWWIPAHLRCTQCSILLHLMDICFLTCICLWQISKIQTLLFKMVGTGLVSTSSGFVRSSTIQMAGMPQKWLIGPPLLGAGRFDTICTAVYVCCDSYATCRLCRLEPSHISGLLHCPCSFFSGWRGVVWTSFCGLF